MYHIRRCPHTAPRDGQDDFFSLHNTNGQMVSQPEEEPEPERPCLETRVAPVDWDSLPPPPLVVRTLPERPSPTMFGSWLREQGEAFLAAHAKDAERLEV